MNPLFIIAAAALALFAYNENSKNKKRKAAERLQKEQQRKANLAQLEAAMPQIIAAISTYDTLTSFGSGYCAATPMRTWAETYRDLSASIKSIDLTVLPLATEQERSVSRFMEIASDTEKHRAAYNTAFIAHELKAYEKFFDTVEGRSLDAQQRHAVITDEDNNIVIAGAGSGKTTAIVGKVAYVMHRYNIRPQEILLISFTNKSASDLAERVNIEGIEAKTFHKLGKDILLEAESKQASIFPQEQFLPLIRRFFTEALSDPAYLQKVTYCFTDILKPYKSPFEFEGQGEYIQFLKDQNIRPYKVVYHNYNGILTTRLEIVKSVEECRIANFLYFNGIEYDYEYPYEHQTADEAYRQYKPDFRIRQGNTVIYLEHYALNKNGEVPSWFTGDNEKSASEKYHEGIIWKRELHQQHNTTLIETYSHQMYDGVLFDELTTKLVSLGIKFQPKSPQQIWEIINQVAKDEVKTLMELFATFITLLKNNNYTFEQISRTLIADSGKQGARNRAMLEIIEPLFSKYQQYLSQRQEIDFSDMINRATAHIKNGCVQRPYRYIIIDEFQDISMGRYTLVKALLEANKGCKLFCVGDDWQSIYRFAGSDLTLFKDFETHFGTSATSKIETTYRFNSPLIELSGRFIEKNPNQARKKLIGKGIGITNYAIVYSKEDENDDTDALKQIFEELTRMPGIEHKSILILGRYSFDIKRIGNTDRTFHLRGETLSYTFNHYTLGRHTLSANFLTVHKSKGLEADIVIVLNCNSGKLGFPSQLSDDPVLSLLLSSADQFENGEERRLFYVAMTRAKERLYLVAGENIKSKFIQELETGQKASTAVKCPHCKTADMLLRKQGRAKNGNSYKFYGCSNYAYGCDYTSTVWDNQNFIPRPYYGTKF